MSDVVMYPSTVLPKVASVWCTLLNEWFHVWLCTVRGPALPIQRLFLQLFRFLSNPSNINKSYPLVSVPPVKKTVQYQNCLGKLFVQVNLNKELVTSNSYSLFDSLDHWIHCLSWVLNGFQIYFWEVTYPEKKGVFIVLIPCISPGFYEQL